MKLSTEEILYAHIMVLHPNILNKKYSKVIIFMKIFLMRMKMPATKRKKKPICGCWPFTLFFMIKRYHYQLIYIIIVCKEHAFNLFINCCRFVVYVYNFQFLFRNVCSLLPFRIIGAITVACYAVCTKTVWSILCHNDKRLTAYFAYVTMHRHVFIYLCCARFLFACMRNTFFIGVIIGLFMSLFISIVWDI